MVSIVALGGLVVGLFATGFVYVDMVRRGLSRRTRLLWTGFVGVLAVGGFSTVYVADDALYRWYLLVTGGPAVAPLPREVATAFVVVAVATSAVAVLAYGFGSRFGPLRAG